MDKIQQQKDNVAACQRESAAAISHREKEIEQLKVELKGLADRLESTAHQLDSSRRQTQTLEIKLQDAMAEVQVQKSLDFDTIGVCANMSIVCIVCFLRVRCATLLASLPW
jgi:DNA repair exonuclease SbcCD ATPase subunit